MKTKKSLILNLKPSNMKRLVLLCIAALWSLSAVGQNPFAEYGYTPKIATLSKGQFNEFHDQDTVVQIGSVLYNTRSKQIVAFVETDTVYSEATLQPDLVSRWISPDPLADHPTQVGLSPYHYAGNNPIVWTDPDGRCPWCVAWLIVEVGLAIYDAYDAGSTIIDPNASTGEKIAAGGGFLAGTLLPGGGYGTGAKQTVKAVDKAMDANKALNAADNVVDFAKMTFKKEADGSWSKNAYRDNLKKATGKVGDGFDAHHTLPKAKEFSDFFKKAGLDVNDPANMVWRKAGDHSKTKEGAAKSAQALEMWKTFMADNPNAKKDLILKQKDIIEKKVWGNLGDTPTK
jgi:RHS repeat-associated protein